MNMVTSKASKLLRPNNTRSAALMHFDFLQLHILLIVNQGTYAHK